MSAINSIVDSSLWIEYFTENDIDRSIITAIEDTLNLYVPSICLYEVYKKFLSVNDPGRAMLAVDIMKKGNVVNLTPDIAVLAAKLGRAHKLPMADSVIYATAKTYDAEIYTQDGHFENLEQTHYFEKKN